MAMRRHNLREDLKWLKWWLLLLAVCVSLAIGGYWAALYFRSDMSRLEAGTRSNFDVIVQEVTQIEESERIIVENIDRYNALVESEMLAEENRVSLLEDIRRIRNRFRLFPIDVEIREQTSRILDYEESVEFPDEQISVRASRVVLGLPLLHEEDLTRFLNAFLNAGRLMVTTSCSIVDSAVENSDTNDIVPRQIASCEFLWYTFRRELPVIEEFDEFAD